MLLLSVQDTEVNNQKEGDILYAFLLHLFR